MLLVLLDDDGPVVSFGATTVPADEAVLVVAADLAAGRRPDVEALAVRHGSDLDALVALAGRLRAWLAAAPPGPAAEDRGVPHVAATATHYGPDLLLQAPLPLPVVLDAAGYRVWVPGDVAPLVLDAHQVSLLGAFTLPRRPESIGLERLPGNPLLADPERRDEFLSELASIGLLRDRFSFPARRAAFLGTAGGGPLSDLARKRIKRQREILDERPPRAGRVPVYGVEAAPKAMPPLGLGLLFAAGEAFEGGRLTTQYDFVPHWDIRAKAVKRLVADGPGVFLFSDYLWSTDANLAISQRVKELSPTSVVVHGGPDAPKYDGDRERFFAEHPEVDVLVHGEGEVTVPELLAALDGHLDGDLRPLASVAGLTYRPAPGAEPVTTEDRPRLEDLNVVPSPYLTGVFDSWAGGAATMAVLETNRGCPYGCTFCDWGSATLSRIRKYDLDRIFAEIEWMARAQVDLVLLADANFGIFERDVAIAEHLVAMKAEHGWPRGMYTNYAKNTVKHLEPIVRTLIAGGVHGHGIMSVQTFDEPTLKITRRKNLKTEDYQRLGSVFVEARLPIFSDLMLGLPGATLDATRDDLQRLIEQEITGRTYPTQLLANSPMNEPSYRAEWEIETGEGGYLISTRSYTADERREMDRAVLAFHGADTYGILRTVLRWLSVELDRREIDLLEELRLLAEAEPARVPLLAHVLGRYISDTVPPGTWAIFYDELEGLLADRWAVDVAGSEWSAVRAHQLHVLPDRGRAFPDMVTLPHDVVTWLAELRDHRHGGGARAEAPRLGSYGPGTLVVTDPTGTCDALGTWRAMDDTHSAELGWALARNASGRWEPSA